MTVLTLLVTLLGSASAAVQATPRIRVALEVQGGGPAASAAATRLGAEIRTGLQAAGDVEVVDRNDARRVIRVIVSASDGVFGASLLVTEQYDRPTLMVLGIEDDDLAERMMLLQIVNEHQGFAGRDLSELGRQIVASLDAGVFTALRSLRRQP